MTKHKEGTVFCDYYLCEKQDCLYLKNTRSDKTLRGVLNFGSIEPKECGRDTKFYNKG